MLNLKTLSLQGLSAFAVLFSFFTFCVEATAQPLDLSRYQKSADVTGFINKTETTPANDAVLSVPPSEVSLSFPDVARLVKFTLRNDTREWIDINFRYKPEASTRYVLQLPTLSQSTYYTADWAVLSEDDTLLRGSFSFAFGENAVKPSVTRAEEAILLEQRYGDPTIRYVPPPRTQIIIDRDPPQFDPPFTIKLNSEATDPNQ